MSEFQTDFQADALPALQETFGWPSVYTRPSTGHSASITVMLDQHIQQSFGGQGAFFETRSMVFLIEAVDLVLNSVKTLPQRGDRLLINDLTGNQRTYEVAPEGGAPLHAFNDQAHAQLRVPMSLIATDTTTTTTPAP